MITVATKLKMFIVEHDIKQSWLAEQANISPSTLNMIVNGKVWPNLKTALKIAKALNVNVEYLWGEEDV